MLTLDAIRAKSIWKLCRIVRTSKFHFTSLTFCFVFIEEIKILPSIFYFVLSSTLLKIRYLLEIKRIIFLHRCLICAAPLLWLLIKNLLGSNVLHFFTICFVFIEDINILSSIFYFVLSSTLLKIRYLWEIQRLFSCIGV